MPNVDGVSFPRTRWERFVDGLRHRWHSARLRMPEVEEDDEPGLLELLVAALDDGR